MVNLGPSLTKIGKNYLDPYFIIQIHNLDPQSGSIVRIWSAIRNCNQKNFRHDRLKMDQDLPYFSADNFSHDLRVLDENLHCTKCNSKSLTSVPSEQPSVHFQISRHRPADDTIRETAKKRINFICRAIKSIFFFGSFFLNAPATPPPS